MMEILSDLLVIAIKNEIVYAFSKRELKLYRLKNREEFEIEIGMFITFNKTEGFVMNVTSIIEKRMADEKDCVHIEQSKNGPFVVLKAWMVFSQNSSLRSHQMLTGFSDWFGYIRISDEILKKSRDCVYVINITVNDLNYDQTFGACLFRQHNSKYRNRTDDDYMKLCENRETEMTLRTSIESYPDVILFGKDEIPFF
ncbi:unnamed protein product [Caenorhabditis angaria]|uniref:RSD-2 N-terminal domain-containing protein n=1 Tax=Caenorhabditis angaria TaxID=860376 RepID=A0A9P1J4K7_9PELO|nr:unnamed protein product [Caenorhabditis angaria]